MPRGLGWQGRINEQALDDLVLRELFVVVNLAAAVDGLHKSNNEINKGGGRGTGDGEGREGRRGKGIGVRRPSI